MRSYGDPSPKRLPLAIRGLYRLNDFAVKRRGPPVRLSTTSTDHLSPIRSRMSRVGHSGSNASPLMVSRGYQ